MKYDAIQIKDFTSDVNVIYRSDGRAAQFVAAKAYGSTY
jgi:hypothetical protein